MSLWMAPLTMGEPWAESTTVPFSKVVEMPALSRRMPDMRFERAARICNTLVNKIEDVQLPYLHRRQTVPMPIAAVDKIFPKPFMARGVIVV